MRAGRLPVTPLLALGADGPPEGQQTARGASADEPDPSIPSETSRPTAGHGRCETRDITCTAHVVDLDFPGVFQAFRIRRVTTDLHGNPKRAETAYNISNLTTHPANPADIAALVSAGVGL